ncbi:MAG: peptidase T [Anaerolineae bacterium]|nr:peptidase T [Anaerolineae bacterium]
MSSTLERFLRYVRVDTQSKLDSEEQPSTRKQFDLAHMAVAELQALGVNDAYVDEHCYVWASLPSNQTKKLPVIGLIAHLDTSPEVSGANVQPRIVSDYDGGDIVLDAEEKIILSPMDYPDLLKYKGQSLVVTDGHTLLGADDKAGVAEIISALAHLQMHPEFPHGVVRVCFTPDEEVSRGTECFDVEKFGADFAYTLDGGEIGELNFENFNAARARIMIRGRSVHPGDAKGVMINAIEVAIELHNLLPSKERPEYTEGYEGFYMIAPFEGSVDEARLSYIIRDHDSAIFERRKQTMTAAVASLNQKYGQGTITMLLEDQYYNMRRELEKVFHVVELAKRAMQEAGIQPHIVPIRGGTDGARLTYMGLPTPNIFAGGHNFHGRYEYIPVESMDKAVEVILNVLRLATQE